MDNAAPQAGSSTSAVDYGALSLAQLARQAGLEWTDGDVASFEAGGSLPELSKDQYAAYCMAGADEAQSWWGAGEHDTFELPCQDGANAVDGDVEGSSKGLRQGSEEKNLSPNTLSTPPSATQPSPHQPDQDAAALTRKRDKWSVEELGRLLQHSSFVRKNDWTEILPLLQMDRSLVQIRSMHRKLKPLHYFSSATRVYGHPLPCPVIGPPQSPDTTPWTPAEDQELLALHKVHSLGKQVQWTSIHLGLGSGRSKKAIVQRVATLTAAERSSSDPTVNAAAQDSSPQQQPYSPAPRPSPRPTPTTTTSQSLASIDSPQSADVNLLNFPAAQRKHQASNAVRPPATATFSGTETPSPAVKDPPALRQVELPVCQCCMKPVAAERLEDLGLTSRKRRKVDVEAA